MERYSTTHTIKIVEVSKMNEIIFEKNGTKYMIFQGKILEYHKEVEDFDKEAYEKETEYRVRIYRQQKQQATSTQPKVPIISRKYTYKDRKTGCNIYLDDTQVSKLDIQLEEERIKLVKKILKQKDAELRKEAIER